MKLDFPNELTHDCGDCQGFCCVALRIKEGEGDNAPVFKLANTPCQNLELKDPSRKFQCRIHELLNAKNELPCHEYTCFGAGNVVNNLLVELGIDWTKKPEEISEKEWNVRKKSIFDIFAWLQDQLGILSTLRNENDFDFEVEKKACIEIMQDYLELIEQNKWNTLKTRLKNIDRLFQLKIKTLESLEV